MHWIVLLMIAVVLVAIAALTGAKPDAGRPVSRTKLMTVARVVLVVIALILLVAAYGAYRGAA